MNIWIISYFRFHKRRRYRDTKQPVELYFCLVDHFEPFHNGVSKDIALERITMWKQLYPEIAKRYIDSMGNHPIHTIFYPIEKYDEIILENISKLCKTGYFDLEIHLHHDEDTSENMKQTIIKAKKKLFFEHGLLRRDSESGEIIYGFIHGNWALDNSRPDRKWCGVNNELEILNETGCYADFTLPSAPNSTQTKKINSIYYAKDDPKKPKSHDNGKDVSVNGKTSGDLLIIQGPLGLNWKKRKFLFLPGIENGEIDSDTKVYAHRAHLWYKNAPFVKGAPNVKFIKLHTHGCSERNLKYLLHGGLDDLYKTICEKYNDGKKYSLHFASAYKMYKKIVEIETNYKGFIS